MQAETKAFFATTLLVLAMSSLTMLQARMLQKPPEPYEVTAARQAPGGLIIPVAGVVAARLTDTWGAARSAGRRHEGIDILAPKGTPVRAAAPGKVLKFHDSARGGITIYQSDASGHFIFYYAHLISRAPGLREGDLVTQGQVIAYVGQTGNATTPHLHFEIERAAADGQWWRGAAFNPYQSLMAGKIEPPN